MNIITKSVSKIENSLNQNNFASLYGQFAGQFGMG
jgi:hypothetical protein